MKKQTHQVKLSIAPYDNERLATLCGQHNKYIEQISAHFSVSITQRGNEFLIEASAPKNLRSTQLVLEELYKLTETDQLSAETVFLTCKEYEQAPQTTELNENKDVKVSIRTQRNVIHPRSLHQQQYVENIKNFDVNFAVGPAGTGKTYLAVAAAAAFLEQDIVQRLVFVRPAVAAGEKLGFLPGDMEEKVLPYLRPLYDALYDMIGTEGVNKLMERDVIEIAPLAFMRGRTLNDAFIILDEAQNTTEEQMKMFLTRMGFGAKMIITGDITQVDLDKGVNSGLKHAIQLLETVDGCCFNYFDASDSVRHPLVKSILHAYEKVPHG